MDLAGRDTTEGQLKLRMTPLVVLPTWLAQMFHSNTEFSAQTFYDKNNTPSQHTRMTHTNCRFGILVNGILVVLHDSVISQCVSPLLNTGDAFRDTPHSL